MPIPNAQQLVVRIQVTGTIAAAGGRVVPVQNIFHYRRTATVFNLVKSTLNTAFQTAVVTPLLAALNVRYTQVNNLIRCVNDAMDANAQFFPAGVGAIATDSYDSRSAVYIRFSSGYRGRAFNGSKHFSPLSEVDTTGDVLTGAGLARWQAVAAACLVNITDATGNIWVPCILSGPPISQIEVNPTTVNTWDLIACQLNKTVGGMRRRRAGSSY